MGQVENTFDISNQEAATILKNMSRFFLNRIARGNGKSLTALRHIQAIEKAIDLLEKTPD